MSMPSQPHPLRDELSGLGQHWLLLLFLGIALVLTGTMALISPFIATLATVKFVGTLLFLGAVLQIVNAVTCRNWRGFVVNLLVGVLYGVVAIIMMTHTEEGAIALTLMLAASLMVGGIIRIVVAAIEHFHGWPWVMLNGFISLFLGIYIWRHFREDWLYIIGVFVGIDLIMAGWSWIFLAFGARRLSKMA